MANLRKCIGTGAVILSMLICLAACESLEQKDMQSDGDTDSETLEDDSDSAYADGDIESDTEEASENQEYSEESEVSEDEEETETEDGDAEAADAEAELQEYEEEIETEIEADDGRITLDLVEGCNPFGFTDDCLPPVPSTFFEMSDANSPTGVRGNYPEDGVPNYNGNTHFDIHAVNLADGASPSAPILLHFGKDIATDFLVGQHELANSVSPDSDIALFDMDSGRRVMFMAEMDATYRDKPKYDDRHPLIIRPMEPMTMGHRHVLAIRNGVTDSDGNSFQSPAAFAALRDGVITTNEPIESRREDFEEMFDFLEENGYARTDLLVAWYFHVSSSEWLLGSVLSMREETLDIMSGDIDDYSYTVDSVSENPYSNIWKIVNGSFEAPTFLNEENNFDYDDNHHPLLQAENQMFPYTLLIPKSLENSTESAPLVIFGHGMFGTGREYLTDNGPVGQTIREMAQNAGAVVIATDWIGMSAGDQQLLQEEIIPDFNRLGLITDRLQQALINNLTMTEFALGPFQTDAGINPFEHDLIDSSRVYYVGVSLGGIMGASFTSISNRISRAVLTSPGSVWSNLITRSYIWGGYGLEFIFRMEYPDPLTQQLAFAFMQARFDNSDPVNLTNLIYANPLQDAPDKTILTQEGIGDCVVANIATEMLARAIGVGIVEPSINAPFGLESISAPAENSAMSQYNLVDYTSSYMPPESNVWPTSDNNVHWHICFQPHIKQQSQEFLSSGIINQYCDGACDPD